MKTPYWEIRVNELSERLRQPLIWFPFPALISFGLVLVLGGHLLPGLNSRLGSPAHTMEYPAEKELDGGIWLSLHHEDGRVVVLTADREMFSWPVATERPADIENLIRYLNDKVKKQALAMGLNKEFTQVRTSAVLAVDQSLNYIHMRPVIYALAQARITNYGFETRLP